MLLSALEWELVTAVPLPPWCLHSHSLWQSRMKASALSAAGASRERKCFSVVGGEPQWAASISAGNMELGIRCVMCVRKRASERKAEMWQEGWRETACSQWHGSIMSVSICAFFTLPFRFGYQEHRGKASFSLKLNVYDKLGFFKFVILLYWHVDMVLEMVFGQCNNSCYPHWHQSHSFRTRPYYKKWGNNFTTFILHCKLQLKLMCSAQNFLCFSKISCHIEITQNYRASPNLSLNHTKLDSS